MRFGVFLPIFDELADPLVLADLAVAAEEAGWDGVFFWDHIYYRPPVQAATDPWAAMALAAEKTERVLIGPMVTPLARRRPQVLARQAVAVDRISAGRFVMGVGLGMDSSGGELSRFGEELDDRRRAEMLDESLDVLTAMWSGQPFDHEGRHYTARDSRFLPAPAAGRIPVWVAARWPNRRPLRRAARHDGLFLIDVEDPAEVAAAVELVTTERPVGGGPLEVVIARSPGTDPQPWAEAGATWWLTWIEPFGTEAAAVLRMIRSGPPAAADG